MENKYQTEAKSNGNLHKNGKAQTLAAETQKTIENKKNKITNEKQTEDSVIREHYQKFEKTASSQLPLFYNQRAKYKHDAKIHYDQHNAKKLQEWKQKVNNVENKHETMIMQGDILNSHNRYRTEERQSK